MHIFREHELQCLCPEIIKQFLKIASLLCLQFFTDKEPIFTIPIKNILAVEKLDESSFNKKNVGQKIVYM